MVRIITRCACTYYLRLNQQVACACTYYLRLNQQVANLDFPTHDVHALIIFA